MADAYQKIEKIGEGTYGIVYKARHKESNILVALKKIKMELEDDGIPSTTIREMSALKTLNHPSIIKLYEIISSKNNLYLVFEFVDIDLRSFLDRMFAQNRTLKSYEIKKMAYQLISGMEYCHARGLLHRDLKPQNILVSREGTIKICDFGLCRCIGIPLRTYTKDIVTLWYRPPELLLGDKYYSKEVDVWSIGCILAELFLYRPLFPGDSEIDQLYKIFKILGTPTDDTYTNFSNLPNYQPSFPKWKPVDFSYFFNENHDFIDLIQKLLVLDPLKRVNLKYLITHSYFDGIFKIKNNYS